MSEPRVISFGCRLNAYEAAAMRRMGAGPGDAVVVNTCAVTNEAVRQARQAIRRERRERPDARIVVTGCAAQTDPQGFAGMDEVDAVLGNHEKMLPESWRRLAKDDVRVRVNDIMSVRETAGHLIDGYGDKARAFLQIQNGCDHRCTFCIIPFARGNSRSVPVGVVVDQAKRLAGAGHREIVFTGVDITSYGADLPETTTLGALVGAVLDRVPELYRLRLSSIDGAEIDAALIERITGDERLAPHLHLSLQAGDDMILKRMKRRHTRDQAVHLCRSLRARRPEIAFGADLIAGFPTETEAMFQKSLDLVDEAGLQYVHVFPFSPREGTPAARMPQLSRRVVKERAGRLRDRGRKALWRFLDRLEGSEATAVVESGGRARLGNFAQVRFRSNAGPAGALARIRIAGRDGDMLIGDPA
ncbi:MAG: tRNA (N(6)-L-threonylcarbamoyladenosine(37)-C(2))-methylthiotransferase MtaB [Parvularculaceae bacterium]